MQEVADHYIHYYRLARKVHSSPPLPNMAIVPGNVLVRACHNATVKVQHLAHDSFSVQTIIVQNTKLYNSKLYADRLLKINVFANMCLLPSWNLCYRLVRKNTGCLSVNLFCLQIMFLERHALTSPIFVLIKGVAYLPNERQVRAGLLTPITYTNVPPDLIRYGHNFCGL